MHIDDKQYCPLCDRELYQNDLYVSIYVGNKGNKMENQYLKICINQDSEMRKFENC